MKFIQNIKDRLWGNNDTGEAEKNGKIIEEIDNTLLDADKRIEQMLEELRAQ